VVLLLVAAPEVARSPLAAAGGDRSRSHAKAGNPSPFSEGWLPSSFGRTAIAAKGVISTSGPGVNSGKTKISENVIYEGNSANGGRIYLTAVPQSQYPKDYWKNFSDSSAYKRSTYMERVVVFARVNRSVVLAISKIRNYIVTAVGFKQSVRDVVKFAERIRFVS
jgi:hypothetical protein